VKRLSFLSCTVLGLILTLAARTREEGKFEAISKHLGILRTLNTEEVNYRERYGRYGDREQLLAYLRESGWNAHRLEPLKSFQLVVTTSSDGEHYQISLTPMLDDSNKGGWCDQAGFTDERGVIFLGAGLGCEVKRE